MWNDCLLLYSQSDDWKSNHVLSPKEPSPMFNRYTALKIRVSTKWWQIVKSVLQTMVGEELQKKHDRQARRQVQTLVNLLGCNGRVEAEYYFLSFL